MFNQLFYRAIHVIAMPILALVVLSGCTSMSEENAPMVKAKSEHSNVMPIVIVGGDSTMQQWTQEAVTAYCVHKFWPVSLKRISHSISAKHPLFNQPRKTQVLIGKDNALHIHFKLGGVLMDNFSHELIISAPNLSECKQGTTRYEIMMQPEGNAVIYLSKPQQVTIAH